MFEAVGVTMDTGAPRRLAPPVMFRESTAEGFALTTVISLMFEDVGAIEMDGAAPRRLALPPSVMFEDRSMVVVLDGLAGASLGWLNIAYDDLTRRWKLLLKKIQARCPWYAQGVGCATLIPQSSFF